MSDITKHLRGVTATVEALDLIRRGVAPDETTQRLLIDIAGKDCADAFDEKALRQLSNRLNHAAQNLIRSAHAVHGAFADALEESGVIEPASRQPTKYKTSPERREYQKLLMRKRRAAEKRSISLASPPDR